MSGFVRKVINMLAGSSHASAWGKGLGGGGGTSGTGKAGDLNQAAFRGQICLFVSIQRHQVFSAMNTPFISWRQSATFL